MWRIILRRTFYPHLAFAAFVYPAFGILSIGPRMGLAGLALFVILILPFTILGMWRWTRHTLHLRRPQPHWLTWDTVLYLAFMLPAVHFCTYLCAGLADISWFTGATTFFLTAAIPAGVWALVAGAKGHFQKEGEQEQKDRELKAAEAESQRKIAQAEAQEQARQEAKRREVLAACAEAERFYAENAALLHDDMPPALMRTHMADLQAMTDPIAARAAARELIAALQPVVARERQRRKEAEERNARRDARRRQLEAEIAGFESQAEKMRLSSLDRDVIEDELEGIRQRIQRLREYLFSALLAGWVAGAAGCRRSVAFD